MRKLIMAVVLAALAAGIVVAPATAGSRTVFRVFAELRSQHVGPHHTFVFHQRLVKLGHHDQILGHDRVKCRRSTGVCTAVASFPKGKIKAKGRPGGKRVKFTVVGGTRAFHDVEGKVIVHNAKTYNNPLTFRLVK